MEDADNDAKMLEILKNNYTEVYIWIQGQYDYEYLESIVDLREFKIIPSSLAELDKVLKKDNVEYIGTRLHAGIREHFLCQSFLVLPLSRCHGLNG